ncbi:hypothetical protein [Clostridium sp. UBA4395]|uniref:hypothetical protein n=1 Tax=Clostridium sp. UBA4395 TaxID=1946360 RepID=UPI003216A99C
MNYIEQLKDAIDFHHGAIELYANLNTMVTLTNKNEPYYFSSKKNVLNISEIEIKLDESLGDFEIKLLLEENTKKWFDGVIEENKKYKIINLER